MSNDKIYLVWESFQTQIPYLDSDARFFVAVILDQSGSFEHVPSEMR